MRHLIIILILLSGCNSSEKNSHLITSNKLNSPIEYYSYGIDEPSSLFLYPDSMYLYKWSSCVVSGKDSGKYSINDDTIYFSSFLQSQVDTSNNGHNQINLLTQKKYLIRYGRIYYELANGVYNPKAFWIKKGLEIPLEDMLDKNGNGYARHLSEDNRIIEEGQFNNFKIYTGFITSHDKNKNIESHIIFMKGLPTKKYFFQPGMKQVYRIQFYDSTGKPNRIEYHKNGKLIQDSVIVLDNTAR